MHRPGDRKADSTEVEQRRTHPEAVRDLGLAEGAEVVAVVKASDVLVATRD